MGKIVQEKFQVNQTYEPNDDASAEGGAWATDMSARAKKMMPGREGLPGGDYNSRYNTLNVNFNSLPPGMDIEDQEFRDIRRMNFSCGGAPGEDGPAGDRTVDITPMTLKVGFDRKKLRPTDDMYTREHNDAFYDSIEVDGVEGYVERNNMLDRM